MSENINREIYTELANRIYDLDAEVYRVLGSSPSPMIGNARIRRIQGILIVDVTGDAYIFKMTISPNTLVRRFSASAYLFSLVNNATINTTSNKMHNTENASLATPFLVFALPSNVVSFIKPTPSSLLFFRLL